MGATCIGMRRGQQGIDQINAGFDGHHHPGSSMRVRRRCGWPSGRCLSWPCWSPDAAHIVYLQPEQVSYAMREKYAGNTRFQSSLAGPWSNPRAA
jgi:hypothetical protein